MVEKECKACLHKFHARGITGATFCSKKCRTDYVVLAWLRNEYDGTTKQGLSIGIRRYLIKEAGYKCQECGWSGTNPVSQKSTLQVDHKDGNCYNNIRENLRVLCPNCHSLTPSYGALNKGNGRKHRHGAVA